MNQYRFFVFLFFSRWTCYTDISTQVDSTLVVKDVTQGRNTCPSVPSCGVSCFYMGRSGPPRSIVFGQEWQTKAEIPGHSGTSHHCVPKHTCPPISTKNDRDILSRLWGLKRLPTSFRRCEYFLSMLFCAAAERLHKAMQRQSLDALVGPTWEFTAHREKHFQCMPSLVVSLDIQAPLKASHKVGDLAEAWSRRTNRQLENADRDHSCKTCKPKIIRYSSNTHPQSRWFSRGVVRVHK